MLELNDCTGFRFNVRDVQIASDSFSPYLLPVRGEAVFPIAMPLSFRLPPWIAVADAHMRPMPHPLTSAFGDNACVAACAKSTHSGLGLAATLLKYRELHNSLQDISMPRHDDAACIG
nr:hypothetical protein [Rhizobium ruizarguesonis]